MVSKEKMLNLFKKSMKSFKDTDVKSARISYSVNDVEVFHKCLDRDNYKSCNFEELFSSIQTARKQYIIDNIDEI